jgi:hypothetical protein
MPSADNTALHVSVAQDYFRRADAGRADIADLMTEDCQVYFPKFGIRRGRGAILELAGGMGSQFEAVEHDFSTYTFISSGPYLVVEGTTRGSMKNGKAWAGGETPGGRFCNVFEFKDGLICRVHIYLDPDYVGEDAPRFLWGRDGRDW